MSLFELSADIEKAAQYYAGQIIHARGGPDENQGKSKDESDWQSIDVNSLELTRPRSVRVEHAAYQALRRLRIDRKLEEQGFNRHQKNAAIGLMVARMAEPGSELSTHRWLRERSGLGELIDYDFGETSLARLYRASDLLLRHKEELESYVYGKQKSLFRFEDTISFNQLRGKSPQEIYEWVKNNLSEAEKFPGNFHVRRNRPMRLDRFLRALQSAVEHESA